MIYVVRVFGDVGRLEWWQSCDGTPAGFALLFVQQESDMCVSVAVLESPTGN
jgi:hypothetical protein